LVGIDGEVLPEFDKLINSVTVTLRKTHETGEVTIQEINLTKAIVNGNEIPELVYGSVGDKDREKWLDYDYKATFQMKGGKTFETAWIKQASAMINLYPPYIRRIIQLDGNMDELRKKGVRAISVDLEYDFLNEPQHARLSIRTGESLEGKQLEITMPKSQLDYNYKLTWYLEDGQQKTMSGKSSGGFLFLDTI